MSFWIVRSTRPIRAAICRTARERRDRTLGLADDRRREDRAKLVRDAIVTACARSSGVKSIRSSIDVPFFAYAGGFVGIGCVGEYHSPGTSPFSTGFSSNGQTGFPVTRSNTYRMPCFVGTATDLMALPSTVMSARIGADPRSKSQIG
jgi:hypothetical protein